MIFLTIISIIWLLSVVESYRLNRLSAKIAEEIAEEEAIRTPTLSQETILAGITMPAGTRLELLHQGAVGTQWVKPEYFESAYFPKPILWQGVPVTQLHRFLDTKQDNDYFSCRENNPNLSDEECSRRSSYKTTRILWSVVVGVVDKPLKTGKFYCQGEITWGLIQDNKGNTPSVDASLPPPAYQKIQNGKCQLAKDDTATSENGFLALSLPVNSRIFVDTMMGDDSTEFWVVITDSEIHHYNLFSLNHSSYGYDTHLNLDTYHLQKLKGEIAKGTPECPLPPKSYISWSDKEANTLYVYTDTPVAKCGQFNVVYLKQHPDEEW
ncbi:Uncharacterised protein [Moraxella lacunata]|uniref:Uncharacterized protein n=2 Tax=Moraxella lacunata TaxID=477 RepID=A0A378TU74_MORLA|nr:Uncharacterised protein [Moraxella lacunata]